MQSLVIKRLLLLSSSKRLRLEVLRILQKLQAFKKRLFADQCLSNPVVVEREGIFTLYKKKLLEEPQVKW